MFKKMFKKCSSRLLKITIKEGIPQKARFKKVHNSGVCERLQIIKKGDFTDS